MTNGDMIRGYLSEMDDDELCRAATDLIQGNITNAEWEKLKDAAGENIYSRMMLWLSQQSKEEEDPDSADTVQDINRATILRLCNEIENIAQDIKARTMSDSYFQAQCIIDKVRKIGKELTTDDGSTIDRC